MSGVEVIDPQDEALLSELATGLVEARKAKGLTHEAALEMLKDVNYVGTMLVHAGKMDGLVRPSEMLKATPPLDPLTPPPLQVSGAIHTTAATVRPGMQVRESWKGRN